MDTDQNRLLFFPICVHPCQSAAQTGFGLSTPTHFTFFSFRFDTRYGFSVARSPALSCTSQFHVTNVWPSSVGIRFDKTYVPGSRSVKYAVPLRSVITDCTEGPVSFRSASRAAFRAR